VEKREREKMKKRNCWRIEKKNMRRIGKTRE
jgi:hypothetical protein